MDMPTALSATAIDIDKLAEERRNVAKALSERLESHDNSRKTTQDKLHKICEKLKKQINELESRINKQIEELFNKEDNRLQAALGDLHVNTIADDSNLDNLIQAIQKAKAELLVIQSYDVTEHKYEGGNNSEFNITNICELKLDNHFIPEMVEVRKPTDVRITDISGGLISVSFTHFNQAEIQKMSEYNNYKLIKYKCSLSKILGNRQSTKEYPLGIMGNLFVFSPISLTAGSTYSIRVKTAFGDRESEWSDKIEFTVPEYTEYRCSWKECPDDIKEDMMYSLDKDNFKIATMIGSDDNYCTIIGNAILPVGTIVSWNVIPLESRNNNGDGIYIGVAPFDINQNDSDNRNKCGWYFGCWNSILCSGPPHNYRNKEYGSRKGRGQYVHSGDSVGVIMNMSSSHSKGELSFVLDNINLGVAFDGIPLDRPLVPCVLLKFKNESIELDSSEVKENVDFSIPVPSDIKLKGIAWDSIAFVWNSVAMASAYQVEVDGSIQRMVTKNKFSKSGLFPGTEYSFRIRAIKEKSVSDWSEVVKWRTQKVPEFNECVWKECPGYVTEDRKYSIDKEDPRIASKIGDGRGLYQGTIIGNIPLPLNEISSWKIKLLRSEMNDGYGIFIGVVPYDVNQNGDANYELCGWYFNCCLSTLYSGPPHNYRGKEYGQKRQRGKFLHKGDIVGVVMDTTKGDLSFSLFNVEAGIAYNGIPLDKPLVPCVILEKEGDSVGINLPDSSDESCVIS